MLFGRPYTNRHSLLFSKFVSGFCIVIDRSSQEEVEKRRQRARKFGTALVEDGLQPAMTSQQAATSADKGLTAAGNYAIFPNVLQFVTQPCAT